jgi:hypothetical protein
MMYGRQVGRSARYGRIRCFDLLPILGMGEEHQGLTAMPKLED